MMRRRLEVLGQMLDVEVDVEASDRGSAVATLFEAGRVVSERLTDFVKHRALARGEVPSCSDGCSACCRQLVPISSVEAVHLAGVVEAMAPARQRSVRRRFAEAIRRLEEAGLVDRDAPAGRAVMFTPEQEGESLWETVSRKYRELAIDCPLLERRRCSVYEDRPLVCREYYVTTPASRCADPRGDVRALPRPARMSEVLADVANVVTSSSDPSIPLVLALEWAAHHGSALAARASAETLVAAVLDEVVDASAVGEV